MVYRGKPSTGCLRCRARKIKCDERPEGCIKCADKGWTCPGYENALDRYFQDESASVQAKAEKAKAKAIAARDERDKKDRAKLALSKLRQSIGITLLCPLIDQGISFFMSNYALGLDQPPIQSSAYHKHLSTHGFHPTVSTSMTALGLAGVANMCMDVNLKREAMRWYMKALKMTNAALESPVEVKTDNTLLATMLLSVFEATNNDKTFAGWSSHVSGSASLLRMRGPRQFSTPAGRRMYMQTVGLLTMNCMAVGEPLPDFVHELNKDVAKWEDRHDPGNKFFHLHIDVIDFRAQIVHREIATLQAILDRALEIDQEAQRIFEAAQDDWKYEEERCDKGLPGVYGTSYHVYPHLASAQTWNWVRYNRVYIHDIIRNTLIAGLSATPPVFVGTQYMKLLDESTTTLYKLQDDILASIPQYLGDTPRVPMRYFSERPAAFSRTATPEWLLPPSAKNSPAASAQPSPSRPPGPSTTTPPPSRNTPSPRAPISTTPPTGAPKLLTSNFLSNEDFAGRPACRVPAVPDARLPILRVSGGYSSLWALYIAGATPIASPESQEYVLQCFSRVGSEFGINQAKVLANALKLKIQLDRGGFGKEGVWRGMGMAGGMGSDWPMEIVPAYIPRVGRHMESD